MLSGSVCLETIWSGGKRGDKRDAVARAFGGDLLDDPSQHRPKLSLNRLVCAQKLPREQAKRRHEHLGGLRVGVTHQLSTTPALATANALTGQEVHGIPTQCSHLFSLLPYTRAAFSADSRCGSESC